MTKFWTYMQNNSGGYFHVNEDVSQFVIIEAPDVKRANAIAQTVGIYFDGHGDCSCCGNRWSEEWDEEEGKDVPEIFGEPARDFKTASYLGDYFCTIHYLDGAKEQFKVKRNY